MEHLERLEWTGRAWPAAVTRETLVPVRSPDGTAVPGNVMALAIQTTGRGKEYRLDGPASFWMNFAEGDGNDPAHVERFVRRRGDPFGNLSAGAPTDTSVWPMLAETLKPAAACWTGIRGKRWRMVRDPQDMVRAAEMLMTSPWVTTGIDITPFTRNSFLHLSAKSTSLAAFMCGSALADLFRVSSEMLECHHCGEWFRLLRHDSRFCSASCRALAALEKRKGK